MDIFLETISVISTMITLVGITIEIIYAPKSKLRTLIGVSIVVVYVGLVYLLRNNVIVLTIVATTTINLSLAFIAHTFIVKKKHRSGYSRFEKIDKLSYGYVEYRPFYWLEENISKGIGIEVLAEVFEGTIELNRCKYDGYGTGSNWKTVFQDLCAKKFDIIITPLFETRSRISNYRISYCSPLFYSNIGIYVRKNDLPEGFQKLTFADAIKFLKNKIENQKWVAETFRGELAELLIQKHELGYNHFKKNGSSRSKTITDKDFGLVLENICDANKDYGDFTFMEVFKVDSIMNANPTRYNLENILKDSELLYPVSFAVRKEDTVLRNLINLRLMELRNEGKLEEIIKKVSRQFITPEKFKEIFIQEYDIKKLQVKK